MKAGKASMAAAYVAQQAAMAARREAVTIEMIEKYRTEPDRAYAEEMWGSLLAERGVDPSTLAAQ